MASVKVRRLTLCGTSEPQRCRILTKNQTGEPVHCSDIDIRTRCSAFLKAARCISLEYQKEVEAMIEDLGFEFLEQRR